MRGSALAWARSESVGRGLSARASARARTRAMRFAFAVMCAGLGLVFADQNLLAPNLTAIAVDLGIERDRDYKLGGQIAFAFFLLGAPASIAIGSLADYYPRTKLFAWTMILGSCPNFLALWVTTFDQLYWLRALTGIAVGGAAPLTYSLSSDLFGPSERTKMSAVTGLSMSLGVVFGQATSGFLGERYGWRVPFAVVAIPGMCVAIILMFFVQEPKRGGMEATNDEEENPESESLMRASTPPIAPRSDRSFSLRLDWSLMSMYAHKLRGIVGVRTVAFFLAQGISGCVPWSMINTFFNDFLAQDKGLGVKQSTTLIVLFSIGGMLGTVGAGWYGQHLYNQNPAQVSIFMGASAIVGVVPTAYLVLADYDNSNFDLAIKGFISLVAGAIACCVGVNIRAVLLNVLHPINRGTAFSLFMLTDDLGKGLGPLVVAGFVAALGRESAFLLSVMFWIPCGILIGATAYTVPKDLQTVSARYQNDLAEEARLSRVD